MKRKVFFQDMIFFISVLTFLILFISTSDVKEKKKKIDYTKSNLLNIDPVNDSIIHYDAFVNNK